MNTKIILSIIVTLCLSANIYASQPLVYTNETVTQTGKQIERTIFKCGPDEPDRRTVSNYDDKNMLMERTTYGWDGSNGWIPQTKLVYAYTASNEIATVTHTRWNKERRRWSEKSEIAYYEVTDSGVNLLAEVRKK